MGQKSTIETLPTELLEALQAFLRDPKITQLESTARVNALAKELGLDIKVSKSAVNRYALKMDEVGEKLQQSRQIADMWIAKLGNEPQGKVGALLNEVVRNLAFNAALSLAEEDVVDPKLIKELSIAVEKLERASTINENRQREIEQAILEKAADETEKAIVQAGLSDETAKEIKRQILGIE